MTRLRIVNEGDIFGMHCKILLVDEDGRAQDVTQQLRVIRVSIDNKVGAASRVSLECLCWHGEIDAVLDDLVIRFIGRSVLKQWLWKLRKRWFGVTRAHVADATTAGDTTRRRVES